MFSSTASGFTDTPVTRVLIYFTVIVPILVAILEVQYLFDLSISPHLLEWHQFWRPLLNQLIYVNQSEVLLAILLLYNARVVERLMGSRKFLSLVIVMAVYSALVTPAVLYLLYLLPFGVFNSMSPGPTGALIGLTFFYYTLVPVVYRFQVTPMTNNGVEFDMSDKVFFYAVATQLALGNLSGSLVQSVIGWTVASLVQNELIPGKNWRVPFWRAHSRAVPLGAASSTI